jgi:hypothetical protein
LADVNVGSMGQSPTSHSHYVLLARGAAKKKRTGADDACDRTMDSCAHSLGEQNAQEGEGEFVDPRPKWYKCDRSK